MWQQLWDDFDARVQALGHPPVAANTIAQTIQFQINGVAPFAPAPLAPANVHLPEIYSGAPWHLSDVPQLDGRWIAFVGPNPAHDPASFYPSIAQRMQHGDAALVSFFEHRFEPGVHPHPVIHGTSPAIGGPTVWMGAPGGPVHPRSQSTWRQINDCLSAMLATAGLHSAAPLGRVGAMVDMAPWKFNKWSRAAPALQQALLVAGLPYLNWVINTLAPSAIVLLGRDAWMGFRHLRAALPPYHAAGQPVRQAAIVGPQGPLPVFGIPHPAAYGGAFNAACVPLIPLLQAALHI